MELINSLEEIELKKTAVTIGMYDGLHRGHRLLVNRLLEKAQEIKAQSLLITFWKGPHSFFKPSETIKYLSPYNEKLALFQNTGLDYLLVIPFDAEFAELTADYFIEEILINRYKMKYLLIGYDNKIGKNRVGDYHYIKQLSLKHQFELEQAQALKEGDLTISSTQIKQFLSASQVDLAQKCLGYAYSVEGTVVRGKQIGTKIGFPTANIDFSEDKFLPKEGVYCVEALVEGETFEAMANIGINPTVSNRKQLSLEVHLLNCKRNLYGKKIKVSFLQYIRREQKFNNKQELQKQLTLDKAFSLTYFNKKGLDRPFLG